MQGVHLTAIDHTLYDNRTRRPRTDLVVKMSAAEVDEHRGDNLVQRVHVLDGHLDGLDEADGVHLWTHTIGSLPSRD